MKRLWIKFIKNQLQGTNQILQKFKLIKEKLKIMKSNNQNIKNNFIKI
jgi:hypothetical protein